MLAFVLGAAAAARIFIVADRLSMGEEGGGTLTGPFILFALVGSFLLFVGSASQVRYQRAGLTLCLLGFALSFPLFSWFFAGGLWCLNGNCHGMPALFSFDGYSAITLALAALSLALQWLPRGQ
jgi:hypothetical protein